MVNKFYVGFPQGINDSKVCLPIYYFLLVLFCFLLVLFWFWFTEAFVLKTDATDKVEEINEYLS